MKKIQYFFVILFVGLFFSLPIILPFFKEGYFPTHDGEWAVVRAAEMFRELRDFQIPPRFSQALNFGYGYPLFNFAYPGPYYLTTVIHAFGFSFTQSVKILFALTVPLSFYAMYLFSSNFFKSKKTGIISGVLYLYLPYRMVDLYVRGNIGESVAFFLFPLIFWCLYKIVTNKKKLPYIISGAFFIFLLIISHNIMSVYFGIIFFMFLAACFISKRIKGGIFILITFFWGAVLSAFFIIPALFEKQNIKLALIPIADRNLYYVTFEKLFFSKWGYGTPTESNAFPYLIGTPQIIGAFSVLLLNKKPFFEKSLVIAFIILLIIFVLMMFPFFSFIWMLPLLSEINYPWTLLLPIGFLASFLSGAVISAKKSWIFGAILILISITFYLPFAKPSAYSNFPDSYYATNEATTTSSQELMPIWVKDFPSTRYAEKVFTESDVNYVSDILYTSKKISFTVDMKNEGKVIINTIYYPGWRAFVDNKEILISYENSKGIMEIYLPSGSHRVSIIFGETVSRMVANTISVVSFIVMLAFVFMFVALKIYEKKH